MALSIQPAIVQPVYYSKEEHYVSDTEQSLRIEELTLLEKVDFNQDSQADEPIMSKIIYDTNIYTDDSVRILTQNIDINAKMLNHIEL